MKIEPGQLFVVGLNHRKTSLEVREKWAIRPENLSSLLLHLRRQCALEEVLILNTCNRVEIYGVAAREIQNPEAVLGMIGDGAAAGNNRDDLPSGESNIYTHQDGACVRHIFRVTSSLDSLVVGETEIVNQVKLAYQNAQSAGTTGKILNRLFQAALSVSKQVRSQSGIGRCSTSVGSVALDLARKVLGEDLSRSTILIIGAGKMGETTLRHLSKHGTKAILVANRSFDRAQELAAEFAGEAVPFDELSRALIQADVVLSSTSAPHPVVTRQQVAALLPLRGNRPLLLIDLAVPRDIDPAVLELEGVYLYNIDHLSEISRLHLELRQKEAADCEELVCKRATELTSRLLPATPAPVVRNRTPGYFSHEVCFAVPAF